MARSKRGRSADVRVLAAQAREVRELHDRVAAITGAGITCGLHRFTADYGCTRYGHIYAPLPGVEGVRVSGAVGCLSLCVCYDPGVGGTRVDWTALGGPAPILEMIFHDTGDVLYRFSTPGGIGAGEGDFQSLVVISS